MNPQTKVGSTSSKVDETVLKAEVIRQWSKGGQNRPVKIVSADVGPLRQVQGYITQEKFIKGKNLTELERLLGLPAGKLRVGAYVLVFERLPQAQEFQLKSYTNLPGGEPFMEGGSFPPGLGAPQWLLTTELLCTVEKMLRPGDVY